MPAGSEFHTERTATLKPREVKVVWTRGTDNRMVLGNLVVYFIPLASRSCMFPG